MNQRSIRVGPFELREPIHSGGMGVVWSAIHRPSGVDVAVKVIAGEFAWTERFRKAFRNEVRAAATLDHPRIVSVLDAGEIPPEAAVASEGRLVAGSPWLATERLEGSLRSWMEEPRSWAEIRASATGLLDALGHAHARGVIHRDVKPGNILLDRHDKPRLCDFGIAQMRDGEGPIENLGTPAYMAPEQFARALEWIGPWTDLYAFACTLWAVVTGAPPWGDKRGADLQRAHMSDPRPPLRPMMAVPSGLEPILHRALAPAPQSRYYRAAELAADLRSLGGADRIGVQAARRSSLAYERTPPAARTTEEPKSAPLPLPEGPRAEPVPIAVPDDPPSEPDASTRALRGAGIGLYGIRMPPLAGRKAERRAAWDALTSAAQREGPRLLLLRGTTGTGKSRIAAWLSEHAHASCAAEVWIARHSPMEGGLGALLQSWVSSRGLSVDDLSRAIPSRLKALPADPDDPNDSTLAEAAVLVSIANSDGRVRFTHPSERYAAVASVLRRICRERIALLKLEDLQWGPDTLGFVRYLLEEGPPRLLLVGTVRDEVLAERPVERQLVRDLLAHPKVRALSVGPLPKVDRQLMVQALLPLEPSLAAQIAERTSGLPLLAVQVIGDLVSRSLLDPDEVGFRLKGADLPAIDLSDVWTQRLEALIVGPKGADPMRGFALEIAAVLGLSVDGDEWRAALAQHLRAQPCEGPEALAGELQRELSGSLVASGLSRAEDPYRAMSFLHPMLRDTLLARAERAGRLRQWHEICASVLAERQEIDTLQRRARHLLEAGSPTEAAMLWLRCASARISVGEYDAANEILEWWEAAMTEVVPIHDPAWGRGWRVHFDLAYQRGDLDTAAQWAERLSDHARWHGWLQLECRALIDLAGVRAASGRREEASRLLTRASELPVASEPQNQAWIDLTLGVLRGSSGEHALALEALSRARAGFESIGALPEAGDAARFEATAALGAGDPHRAIRAAELAHKHFASIGHRPGVAAVDNALGEAYRAIGDLASAERRYRSARDGMRRLGMARAVIPEANLAIVKLEQGHTREATGLLEGLAASQACQARPRLHVAIHLMLLAAAAASRDWGRFDALMEAAPALVTRGGIGEPDTIRALRWAARSAQAAGEGARAAAALALGGLS